MKKRFMASIFLLLIVFLTALSSCSKTKPVRTWNPGEVVICPHCGREHIVPEKLGK